MKTIWKYDLEIKAEQMVRAPRYWQPLSAQRQGGWIRLWSLIDDGEPLREWKVCILGTGHSATVSQNIAKVDFLDTVQWDDFVWHVFVERMNR